MRSALYTRFELLRTFRNVRFMVLSLGFPLVLFLLVAGPNRDKTLGGIPFPVYYMIGMVAWGTMSAMLSSGARIATERAAGWNRQLRITPLRTRSYFQAKVTSAYALAGLSIALLFLAGVALGVSLTPSEWLTMTGLVLVGLIPFAVMGILLGHLLTPESVGPAIGGVTALLALLGGAYGPIATSGALKDLVQLLPSYWLVQAGQVALGGQAWGREGWLVVAAWTVVLVRLAGWAYRRDTHRV
jgi:ABC-2 type transport system permease protein